MYGHVRPQRAGEHPDQADPADVRIGRRLDYFCQQRTFRVRLDTADRLAVRAGHRGYRMLGRGRERLRHQLKQLLQADALLRGHWDHRVEAAPSDGLFQVIDQHFLIDHLAGQVPVHQAFVFAFLDDRLDQLAPGLGQPVEITGIRIALGALAAGVVEVALGQQADQADRGALAVADGKVERRYRASERGPAGGERVVETAALVIELGD